MTQHVLGRVLVADQFKAAYAAPVGPLRQCFLSPRFARRAVPLRAGRGDLDEWNAGSFSHVFQNVEDFLSVLFRDRPVQVPLPRTPRSRIRTSSASAAMKSQVLTIRSVRQCSSCRPASAARSWVPVQGRPSSSHGSLTRACCRIPRAACAPHRQTRPTLQTPAVRTRGEGSEAGIQPHQALRHGPPAAATRTRFHAPRLANHMEAPKAIDRRQRPPDR